MIIQLDGRQFELGLFELQAAMEKAEIGAGLKRNDTTPNEELLMLVRIWADARLGVKITLTAAWQLWWSVCELIESSRKAYQRMADVSAWLHVDASKLSEDELFGFAANLPRIKAQLQLHDGSFDPTNGDAVYQLVMLATGDEAQAKEARMQALERLVAMHCGDK